ncbi:MAG TPA: type 1 glutamine amidotransferase domain-containing protein [Longimicrobiales bacterium]|nr:type 1 glutamine amidotransferase domain-containing protein [Longimicrobiales bacterium]
MNDLDDTAVAILATDGFEEVELTEPREALEGAGATTRLVSPGEPGATIRSWRHAEWGDDFTIDENVADASADDFDALLLPGGVLSPDRLRLDEDAVRFVKRFFATHKPVAAICHGPWMIVEAGAAQGRRMTSYPSIRTDVQNAGATWLDREVVVDEGLVTSRSPDDLDAFVEKALEEFAEGAHAGQTL